MCHLCIAQAILNDLKVDAERSGDPVLEAECEVMQRHLDMRRALDESILLCDSVLKHQPNHPIAARFKFLRERMVQLDRAICDMGQQMETIIMAGDVQATAPGSNTVN